MKFYPVCAFVLICLSGLLQTNPQSSSPRLLRLATVCCAGVRTIIGSTLTCRKQVWSIRKHSCDGDVSIATRQRCSCHIGIHSGQWMCTSPFQDVGQACSGPLCVPTAVFWLRCFRFKDEKYIIKKYASKYFDGI